jgi:hypothetical protein
LKPSKIFKMFGMVGLVVGVAICYYCNIHSGNELSIISFLMLVLGNQYASEERLKEVVDALDKQFNSKGKTS